MTSIPNQAFGLGGSGEDNGVTLHGYGFDTETWSHNEITVCGIKSVIEDVTATTVKFAVPMLPVEAAFDALDIKPSSQKLKQFTISHSNPWLDNGENVNDNDDATFFEDWSTKECHITFDLGDVLENKLSSVKYETTGDQYLPQLTGNSIQVSNDGDSWTTVLEISPENTI